MKARPSSSSAAILPFTSMVPEVGRASPAVSPSSVLLSTPFDPSTASPSPDAISNEISRNA